MKRPERTGLVFVTLAAAGMVMLGVAFVWLHIATPSDGARLAPGQSVWQPDGVLVTPLRAQAGSLRPGDLVVAVDGRELTSYADVLGDLSAPRPAWREGQTVTYTVVRGGVRTEVPVTLGPYPLDVVWQQGWSTILFALVFEVVALYIVLRRPAEKAGRVLLLSASAILGATTWTFGMQISDLAGGVGFWLYKATTFAVYMLFWIGALHFALIFPRPNALIASHPRRLVVLYITPYALFMAYLALARIGATNTLNWIGQWIVGENVLAAALLALMVAAIIASYRASRDAETRAKIRWVVFGALLSGISGLLLWNIPSAVLGQPLISANMLGLLILPFPLTIAIAILRHRLFDIDTILNRTLLYGGLTGVIVGIYALIVGFLGALFQTRGSPVIAFVAAALVAVLFQPLRERLQRLVNRLMYGERDNPYAVLSRLGQQLEMALAPEAVLPSIVETVAQALKLPCVAIEVRDDDQLTLAASYGLPTGKEVALPLIYHGAVVGRLLVQPRVADEPLTAADMRLLEDIAHQASIAVHAARLTTDLQRSRERLVMAREEERRRLRRDLHDGLGPTLAGMTLKAGAIRNLLARNPGAADALLAELSNEIEVASADIRRLVYALRPPALDELGLVAALRAHAAQYELAETRTDHAGATRALHITIEAPETMPALPAAVEVAVYRIVCEALTNVARHARASACHVRLAPDETDNTFKVEIIDDGVGVPLERTAGIGLLSMRERAEELGGACVVERRTMGGTRVEARLPMVRE